MNPKEDSSIEIFEIVRKAFTFEHSALIPHSLGLAYVIQDYAFTKVKPKIEVAEVLVGIFSVDVIKGLILTMFVFAGGLGMYIVVFVFDFITGLKASKREHVILTGGSSGYIQTDKLWSSVWKFFAVLVISFILTVFSCILVFIEQTTLHQGGLLLTLFFFFMIISFEIHGIGKNQQRRFGYKPPFYNKMDWFFAKIGDLLMLRIRSLFLGNSYDNFSNYKSNIDSDKHSNNNNNKETDNKDEDNGNFAR